MSLALTLSDTTYAGEASSNFIKQAIIGAQTISGGHVFVKDGIKKKYTIKRMNVADMIQDYAAKPYSSGTTTIDSSVLEPATYMLYAEFDPHDFEDYWNAPEMAKNLVDAGLPATTEAALVSSVLAYHNDFFDKAIWQGCTTGATPYDKFNGFIHKAKVDSTVLDVTVTASAFTATTIIAEMEKFYQKIPAALRFNRDFKIFMNYTTFDIFSNAQIAQTYKGIDATQRAAQEYKGVKIIPLANFPDSVIMGAKGTADQDSNLYVGINSTDDNQVTLGRLQANSEVMFIKVEFKADTAFGWGKEVVLYQLA